MHMMQPNPRKYIMRPVLHTRVSWSIMQRHRDCAVFALTDYISILPHAEGSCPFLFIAHEHSKHIGQFVHVVNPVVHRKVNKRVGLRDLRPVAVVACSRYSSLAHLAS